MSLGWIVCVVSIIRLKVFYDYWTGASDDPTWELSQTVSGIEVNVAIWTGCGPAMKAILTRFSPKFFGSRTGSRPSRNVYYSPNGYELSDRGGQEKSGFNTNYSAVIRARDDDASSQDAIVQDENLVRNKTREVRVDFELEQQAASLGRSQDRSRHVSQYNR
ncbi:hypothetical protein LTR78_003078 [Recurvomyces mirabilis]|uniref:Rhodopsin domain-containing protein n=1 Tax=Recurvomyces mirabilis TaxID=574656 RepID=A0AAE0WS85_9PEZI|nr:hypothetical protein LTR78_003078 [Recurvomyces mirabilis]KAK5157100.1 hypothetical protein LTS14_004618 [Recurvomyces mirabilis]